MDPSTAEARRPRFELMLITDGAPDLIPRMRAISAALDARVAVLLRDKQASADQLLTQAKALRVLTRARGATLLISQALDIVVTADADGVHLPEASCSVAEARARLGDDRLVGVSRHDLQGIVQAERAAADYASLAPIFDSPGKGTPLGIDGLARAVRAVQLPVFALGGVRADSVARVIQAGACGVAVIREVLAAPDPSRALTALLRALTNARSS